MASSTRVSSVLASRYAAALIDLAEAAGKTASVERDLKALSAMIDESPDLALLLNSPVFSRKSQTDALNQLAVRAGFDRLTQNFLGVLVHNRRLNAVGAIIEAFRQQLSSRRGEVTVKVETAQDLSPAQIKALQDALSKGMGKNVSIRADVVPDLMGGMVVTVGSKMIDDSVRRKLEKLKLAMGKQANQNLKVSESA